MIVTRKADGVGSFVTIHIGIVSMPAMNAAQSLHVIFVSPCLSDAIAITMQQNAVTPLAHAPGPAPANTCIAKAIQVSSDHSVHEKTCGLFVPLMVAKK